VIRYSQIECLVRTSLVEVADVDAQDVLELATAVDEDPLEALPRHTADPALGATVRIRRLDRRSGDLDAFAALMGPYRAPATAKARKCGPFVCAAVNAESACVRLGGPGRVHTCSSHPGIQQPHLPRPTLRAAPSYAARALTSDEGRWRLVSGHRVIARGCSVWR